jgi:NAD-dependent DNA ligase
VVRRPRTSNWSLTWRLSVRTSEPRHIVAGPLSGQTIVVTGRLTSLTRGEAEAAIKAAGGAIGSTVTRKTSAVVVGEEPGSKADRARELKVPIWSEADLVAALAPRAETIDDLAEEDQESED